MLYLVSILEKYRGKIYLSEYVLPNEQQLNNFLRLCDDSHHFVIRTKKIKGGAACVQTQRTQNTA